MALVQLGIAKRIVYINSTSLDCKCCDSEIILINPSIIEQKGKTEFWEACTSCLDNFGLVKRPYSVVVKYQDLNGKWHERTFKDFEATVLSHELDHLDGVFHMDRAKEILYMGEKEERMKWREKYPYKIISKDCEFRYPSINKKR